MSEQEKTLSAGQRAGVHAVSIDKPNVLFTGSGGTGKSLIVEKMVEILRSSVHSKTVAVTATA